MRFSRSIRSMAVLALFNGYIPMRSNPLWAISSFLSPFSFFFLVLVVGRGESVVYALIGGLVLSMSSSTFGLLGDIIWYRSSLKIQDMLLTTPAPHWAYILGLALSAYVWGSPSIAGFLILLGLYGILGSPTQILAVLGLTAVLWIVVSPAVFLMSTMIRNERFVWPLASILGLGLSVFPPVYYPVDLLPQWLWPVALLPPTASTALLIQKICGVSPEIPQAYIEYSIAVLLLQLAAGILILGARVRSSA